MKAFLEEYGLVIVIVIVVAMLILVAALTSSNGKGRLIQTFNAFTNRGQVAVERGLTLEDGSLGESDTNFTKAPKYYDEKTGSYTDKNPDADAIKGAGSSGGGSTSGGGE